MTDTNLWEEQAKRWKYVGQPLRPNSDDVGRVEQCFAKLDGYQKSLTGILLGVTPELAKANLDVNLLAVDSEQTMIDLVWPGNTETKKAIVGDWFSLSKYVDDKVDWVMADGSLNALEFSNYDKLFSSISAVLKKDGLFSLRIFQRPNDAEDVNRILTLPQTCGNFHVFKWRLVMALQGSDFKKGVKLADVWTTFNKKYPSLSVLSSITGWSLDEINTINNYKNVQSSYTFPKVNEVAEIAKKHDLKLLETNYQKYELSERCPHLLFKRQ